MTSTLSGQPTTTPILAITDAARSTVIEARSGERNADELALFVEVSGVNDGTYTYDMWFQAQRDAGASDIVQNYGDLTVVITASSGEKLNGATLDAGEAGLVLVNPNTPAPPPGLVAPTSDLSTPIEMAVAQLLEQQINPQIASHGGRADLVAVEANVAYLRLSGGCQGCGHAQATFRQGIAVAIQESFPEIVDVVDVTEHAEGENPYYEAGE